MCGIAGLFHPVAGVDVGDALRRMADVIRHRGPDDEGFWIETDGSVGLAHRRLSIIDLSPQGHQPMPSASGRYVVAYNGEIYNFEELRSELQRSGQAPPWRGHSDTEVLLACIDAWGVEQALQRTVGMFAIALWDRQDAVLTLARDRLGEKPLYYGRTRQGFAFSSELKSLRAVEGSLLTIDTEALGQFMQFGYVPAPRSIYARVSKLPPGCYVQVRSHGVLGAPVPYWKLSAALQGEAAERFARAGEEEIVRALHDQLHASVGLQMVSDVPLGAFLSGGIDSSLIVALMQAQSRQRVRTFTIGFREREFDEAPFARAVAQHLGTEHTELYVSAENAAAVIPDLPSIYDEPFADSSQIPTALVARLTRRHVTVSLSGDGGDELFAGYPRYSLAASLWRRLRHIPLPLRRLGARALQTPSARSWDRFVSMLTPGRLREVNGQRVHRLARIMSASDLGVMYVRLVSQWQSEDGLVLNVGAAPPAGVLWPATGTPLQQMRHWDAAQYLPDDLLVKVDRAAMSASLESRAPLLDHRVAEMAFAMPDRMLLREGRGKWILRRVLDRYIPRSLIERPKTGFGVPLAQWLNGHLREWASDLLDPRRIRGDGLLDADKVAAMWSQHESGAFDRSAHLWNIVMFQAWHAEARACNARASSPMETAA